MRCVDADGNQIGVIPTSQALQLAHETQAQLNEGKPVTLGLAECRKAVVVHGA